MEKLKGYNFELKKGDLILLKQPPINSESDCISYIGVVKSYDGKGSQSGVISKGYMQYGVSNDIREINSTLVFCWYNGAFRILKDFDGNYYNIKNLDDLKEVRLYKLNEDETKRFKSLAIKTKIANSL